MVVFTCYSANILHDLFIFKIILFDNSYVNTYIIIKNFKVVKKFISNKSFESLIMFIHNY